MYLLTVSLVLHYFSTLYKTNANADLMYENYALYIHILFYKQLERKLPLVLGVIGLSAKKTGSFSDSVSLDGPCVPEASDDHPLCSRSLS